MFPRTLSLCRFVIAGVAAFAGARAVAQGTVRSPFLPPQASGSSAPTQDAPLEYRGYLLTEEGLQFRIYDPARKAGAWVKLNERNPDFDVIAKQHNTDHESLTIEHGGKVLTLAERKAKIVSAGNLAQATPPPPAAPPGPAINVAPAVTQSVVLNPTPADEQRRLEAVAAEVARRRALREQATQQIGQGTQAQVAVPQVAPQQPARTPQGNTRSPTSNPRQR